MASNDLANLGILRATMEKKLHRPVRVSEVFELLEWARKKYCPLYRLAIDKEIFDCVQKEGKITEVRYVGGFVGNTDPIADIDRGLVRLKPLTESLW